MRRLLAIVLALLLWPTTAESGARVPIVEVSAAARACAVPPPADARLDAKSVDADRFVVESEPDRGARRMSEGRHATPAAPFRTVLLLASASERLAGDEATWRLRPTIAVYYATAPPRQRTSHRAG